MRNPWRRVAIYRRVIVNLKTEKAIRGVLVNQTGSVLTLKSAELLEPGGDGPIPIDGEILVDVENVDFVQTVSSEA